MKTPEQRIEQLEKISEEQNRALDRLQNEIAALRHQIREHKHVQGDMTFGAIAQGFGGMQP